METSLRKLFEKQKRVALDVPLTSQNPEEYAQFIQDIDKTWVSDQNAESMGYSLMKLLQEVTERDAAMLLSELLKPYLELDLNERLNAVGILVGELTPGRSTPSGVRSILRSGTPMVLISNEASPDFHRPSEIARSIAEMVCGHENEEGIVKFLQAFDQKTTLENGIHSNSIE